MTTNRASVTTITCSSAADGVRLSQALASPAAWPGAQVPDMVAGEGAVVTLTWFTAVVSSAGVSSAVAAAKATVAPAPASVTSTSAGKTSMSRI
jgi:hypothetical protein